MKLLKWLDQVRVTDSKITIVKGIIDNVLQKCVIFFELRENNCKIFPQNHIPLFGDLKQDLLLYKNCFKKINYGHSSLCPNYNEFLIINKHYVHQSSNIVIDNSLAMK